jgi:AraC-like DNA-binding protein
MIELNDGLKLRFSNMGHFIGGQRWRHPEIAVPTYEIIFVTAGEVYIEEEGSFYLLTEGDMLCLRPGLTHRGYKETDNTRFYWLHFWAENYDSIGVYRHRDSDTHNHKLFFRQLNHLAKQKNSDQLIECKLAAFLLELSGESNKLSKLFSDASEHVRINISSAPTVQSVADHFGYEPHYLSRYMKSVADIHFRHLINSYRMDNARLLLENTERPITEIAVASGYDCLRTFNRVFQELEGMTPTAFRQQNKR